MEEATQKERDELWKEYCEEIEVEFKDESFVDYLVNKLIKERKEAKEEKLIATTASTIISNLVWLVYILIKVF